MVIGITGKISSGKSTVGNIFKRWGAHVIDADKVGRAIIKQCLYEEKKHPHVTDYIKQHFGQEIITKDRTLDRKKLALIIFTDSKERKSFNAIIHPLITKEIQKKIIKLQTRFGKQCLIVLEAFEFKRSYLEKLINKIILIKSDSKNIRKRTAKNRKFPPEIFNNILKAQKHRRKFDFIVINNTTREELKKKLEFIFTKIVKTE